VVNGGGRVMASTSADLKFVIGDGAPVAAASDSKLRSELPSRDYLPCSAYRRS